MSAINTFLLQNNLRIATNPCVSPDFCLDWPALRTAIQSAQPIHVWPHSRFETAAGKWVLLEDVATGDCAWRLDACAGAAAVTTLADGAALKDGAAVFPATFANLLRLKNLIQEHNPKSTIFPSATEQLGRIAQVAPSFGIAITDFNADGLPDLFLAQNFHSAQIETGHYDGGLSQILLNRGKGHLEHMSAGESGISIPGDAKAATVCNLDGNALPDVLVSQNSGALVPLLNRFEGSVLQVKLPPAKAPGATVVIERAGTPKQMAEYHAGGGYLSQNPSVLTFGLGAGPVSGKIVVTWADGKKVEKSFTAAGSVVVE